MNTNASELKLQYAALMAYIEHSMVEMTNLDSKQSFTQYRRMKNLIEYEKNKFNELLDSVYKENTELRLENERLKKYRDIVRLENEKEILNRKIDNIKRTL